MILSMVLISCLGFLPGLAIGSRLRISNGEEVDIESYPFMMQLTITKSLFLFGMMSNCGAVLISPTFALTAGHCLRDILPLRSISATYGCSDVSSPKCKRVGISSAKVHPEYFSFSILGTVYQIENDIAVLKLAEPVYVSQYAHLPLHEKNVPLQEGFTIGWGITEYGHPSNTLKGVIMPVIECAWPQPPTAFCTANINGHASKGDSGGPFFIDGILYGIASTAAHTGNNEFTSVPLLLDFIEETLNQLEFENYTNAC